MVPPDPTAGPFEQLQDQPVFHPGQALDNTYRIVRLIGEGGMGTVYEATHARLAGRYAIKVILRGLSDNPEAAARFDREARITSGLQHPNVVQVIDFNRLADGTEYLVMEYLQGEPLGARLRRVGALPVEAVAGIVEQIAAALTAAHSHGIVHRDLKPDNVFLLPVQGSAAELVKVLDFGISKVQGGSQAFHGPQSGLMGTPQYMAPEQCRGEGAAMNGASDQFALAVLTFEMLTGVSPFAGDSVGSVLARVLYEHPPAMDVAPAIERVVRRGLAKAPQDRFPSIEAFAQALRGAIDGRAGAAARPASHSPFLAAENAVSQVITETRLATPRRPWRWVLATAALVSVAGLFALGGLGGLGRQVLRRPLSLGLLTDVAHPVDVYLQRRAAPPLATRIIPSEPPAAVEEAPAPAPAPSPANAQDKDQRLRPLATKALAPKALAPKATVTKATSTKTVQGPATVGRPGPATSATAVNRGSYPSAPRPVPATLSAERPLAPRLVSKPPLNSRAEVQFDEDGTLPLTLEQPH